MRDDKYSSYNLYKHSFMFHAQGILASHGHVLRNLCDIYYFCIWDRENILKEMYFSFSIKKSNITNIFYLTLNFLEKNKWQKVL